MGQFWTFLGQYLPKRLGYPNLFWTPRLYQSQRYLKMAQLWLGHFFFILALGQNLRKHLCLGSNSTIRVGQKCQIDSLIINVHKWLPFQVKVVTLRNILRIDLQNFLLISGAGSHLTNCTFTTGAPQGSLNFEMVTTLNLNKDNF